MRELDLEHELDASALDPARPRGLLLANTRALWAPFVAAWRTDPELRASLDPIERYVERAVAAHPAAAEPDARVVFAHRTYDGAYLPFQRLADAAGFGVLTPAHLVVHPIYGPWIALRAIILRPGAPPPPRPPLAIPDAHDAEVDAALARALAATGPEAWRAWLAMRDACRVGRAWRYGNAQLRYHYTKDRGEISPHLNEPVDGDPAIR